VGEVASASIIVLMVLLSVALHITQTYRSGRAVERLRAAVAPTAGEVALITYDPDFGTLLARAPAPQARP
jgi:VanZ family protein